MNDVKLRERRSLKTLTGNSRRICVAAFAIFCATTARALPTIEEITGLALDDLRFTQVHGQYNGYVNRPHTGVDIAMLGGTPQFAGRTGRIVGTWDDVQSVENTVGNAVEVLYPDGSAVLFAHCRRPYRDIPNQVSDPADPSVVGPRTVVCETAGTGAHDVIHAHLEFRKFAFSTALGNERKYTHPRYNNIYPFAWPGPNRPLPDDFYSDWVDPLEVTVGEFDDRWARPRWYDALGEEIRPGLAKTLQVAAMTAHNWLPLRDKDAEPGIPFDHYSGTRGVHCWHFPGFSCGDGGGVWLQDLRWVSTGNGNERHRAIVFNTQNAPEQVVAYPLVEGFRRVYLDHHGHANIGEPLSAEDTADVRIDGVMHRAVTVQRFTKADLVWDGQNVRIVGKDGAEKKTVPVAFESSDYLSGRKLLVNGTERCSLPCTADHFYEGFTYHLEVEGVPLAGGNWVAPTGALSLVSRFFDALLPTATAADVTDEPQLLDDGGLLFVANRDVTLQLEHAPVNVTSTHDRDVDGDGVADKVIEADRGWLAVHNLYRIADADIGEVRGRVAGRIVGLVGDPRYQKVGRQDFVWQPPLGGDSELLVDSLLRVGRALQRLLLVGATQVDGTTSATPWQVGKPTCIAVVRTPDFVPSGLGDVDADGLTDWDEACLHRTYAEDPDTDDDGVLDGREVSAGWNPNDPNDPGRILFDDAHDDGTLNVNLWTASHDDAQVIERDGLLKLESLVTDANPYVRTRPIDFDPAKPLTIVRRIRITPANQWYSGRLRFEFAGHPEYTFGVNYSQYAYQTAQVCPTYGVGIFSHNARPHLCASHDNPALTSPRWPMPWGTWQDEKLTWDPVTGNVTYSLGDTIRIEHNVGPLPASVSQLQLFISNWGWWTGHVYQQDAITITQS